MKRAAKGAAPFAPVLLAIVAVLMRAHQLGVQQGRDYDEGVYWESLRAMHGGATLYRDIYYSQPPMFLLTAYPIFEAFGRTIFAARLSCAMFSLLGIAGAYLTGRALAGPRGGSVAMLLAISSAAYLRMSQTLQAEASAIGLSFLCVGSMLAARRLPIERRSIVCAFAGIAFALALGCKFLVVASIVPICACVVVPAPGGSLRVREPAILALAFALGFGAGCAVAIVPFAHDLPAMWNQVVFLHEAASRASGNVTGANLLSILGALWSPLALAAFLGTLVAVANGDRMGIVLGAWFGATAGVLLVLAPMFPHHLVVLVPPLIALCVLSLARRPTPRWEVPRLRNLAFFAIALCVVLGAIACNVYFVRDARVALGPENVALRRAVFDLDAFTKPGDRVVGDGQFVAALADRDPPPWLVDTSFARIDSGQLTFSDAATATADPDVTAVLSYRKRFIALPGYRGWLRGRFTLRADFGDDRELWVRAVRTANSDFLRARPGRIVAAIAAGRRNP